MIIKEAIDKMNSDKNIHYINKQGDIVPHQDTKLKERDKNFDYTKYTSLGFQLAFPLLGGVFIGLKLDGWLNTKPLFIIVFIVLGAIASFYNLYRLTKVNA